MNKERLRYNPDESSLPGNKEKIVAGYIEKEKSYKEALKSGDVAKVLKATEEMHAFLTEMEQLGYEHIEKFSPEVQDLINESEHLNRKQFKK